MGSLGAEEEIWEIWWCYDGWHAPGDKLERMLPPWAKLHRMDPTRPLAEQVANAKVLVPTTGLVDAAAIAAAHDLRLIAQPAAGYANIDLEAAKQRGIPVTIAPGYNDNATAEVALMMMLMLLRRVDEALVAFQQCIIGDPVGHELAGKTLGIIGMGRVGKCLAAAAQGLGMKLLFTDSGSSRQQLELLLQQSDVVSLHCPLNQQTTGMIGQAELSMMKPGAVLINTARGPVIDKAALLQALQQGRLGGVGLDVHWVEPADPQEELYRHPRVLALPHMGSATDEVYERFAHILCENITRVREGRELLHRLC
uniref:D-isomer specific 2-hydroxyacid dehydrogenase NAD-binding domain-containing protein n=1 Tax=Tetradesmus obliquus TaxID=3088 RepID=A0A383V9Z4_TETOB|eukprot:jgi/Sobl393_1/13764/SZX61763.1